MGNERDDELLSRITGSKRADFFELVPVIECGGVDEQTKILNSDIFELFIRFTRKLIKLSRFVEISLITIDPIPLELSEPAIRYIKGDMNYAIYALAHSRGRWFVETGMEWSVEDIFIKAIVSEIDKLSQLLSHKNSIGLDIKTSIEPDDGIDFTENEVNFDPDNEDETYEPEYEYEYVLHEDIEPRLAIGQIPAVLNCLEALLNQLESIIHEPPPEPLTPHQVAVETYVVNSNPLNRTQMAILEGMVYHYDNGNDTLTVGTLHESLNKTPKFNNTAKTISNNMKLLVDLKYVTRPFENQDYIRLTEMGRSLFPRSS